MLALFKAKSFDQMKRNVSDEFKLIFSEVFFSFLL